MKTVREYMENVWGDDILCDFVADETRPVVNKHGETIGHHAIAWPVDKRVTSLPVFFDSDWGRIYSNTAKNITV